MKEMESWASYEEISILDPLMFNGQIANLSSSNIRNDHAEVVDIYNDVVKAADKTLSEGIDINNSVAALRDLDFVIGSLLKAGKQELLQNSAPQRILRNLGRIAGTVPRGTVYTYASCNPLGLTERTFTDTPEEKLFIKSVRQSILDLDKATLDLASVTRGDNSGIIIASQSIATLVESMAVVRRNISPEFFSTQMRPYFDELKVDGVVYAGAGGSQMQVTTIDRMLWGSDCDNQDYVTYYNDNARYLTPQQRNLIHMFEHETNGKSIVTLIKDEILTQDSSTQAIILLKTLLKFRYPHKRVAKNNFELRESDALGSGRYRPEILDTLIALNNEAIERLES